MATPTRGRTGCTLAAALAAGAWLGALPGTAGAQQASIAATATVQGRPLTLQSVGVLAGAGRTVLRVRVDGCGTGAITLLARSTSRPDAWQARPLDGDGRDCLPRELLLPVAHDDAGLESLTVTLEQAAAIGTPAIAQVVISAATLRAATRGTVLF